MNDVGKSTKPLLQAASGLKPARYPVWFMRQAGRYLPEYNQIRSKVDFVELCKSPNLAAEVTLQPLRRFDLDAAIIFSDILIPCTAMGQVLSFDKGHGPRLSAPIRTKDDVENIEKIVATKNIGSELGFVGEAIAKTKQGLQPAQAMIGFAGGPFTVASYMVEGAGSKEFTELKRLLFLEPKSFSRLLRTIANVTIDYLGMQVQAGADIVMLFDTWAGNITPQDYAEFVLPEVTYIFSALKNKGIPSIYFPGQGSDRLHLLGSLPTDVISIDWRSDLKRAISTLKDCGAMVSVQGNLDPQLLMASEKVVKERTRKVVEAASLARGHIFNVGHGLLPHTPPEALGWVVEELRSK